MARKITPTIAAKIAKLSDDGASVRAISEQVNVGKSAVAGYLATRRTGNKPTDIAVDNTRQEADPVVSVQSNTDPLTLEDQRKSLSDLARSLMTDAEAARKTGEHARALSCSRQATAILATLRRISRPEDEDDGTMVRVSRQDLDTAGDRALDRLEALAARLSEEESGWPLCPTCGARVKPGSQ